MNITLGSHNWSARQCQRIDDDMLDFNDQAFARTLDELPPLREVDTSYLFSSVGKCFQAETDIEFLEDIRFKRAILSQMRLCGYSIDIEFDNRVNFSRWIDAERIQLAVFEFH